ncbi:MAG: outer membrane beta-barrel protein [Cyclobacterium sp.]|uniref:hypothetical protein n=1 Tax=Cyclobacterium sp. TaxID=1966343 RepID=UPI00397086F4
MFKKLHLLLFIGCFIVSLHASAQIRLEVYGGPSLSYMDFETSPSNIQPQNEPYKQLSYHLGLGALTRLSDHWQLVTQAELFVRSMAVRNSGDFGTGGFTYLGPTNYEMPTFALGARYNIEKEKYGFYLQPSVGFTLLPQEIRNPITAFNELHDNFNRDVDQVSPYGLGLRLEAGIKRYTRNRNYFMVGIRHQQGLRVTDEMVQTTSRPGEPEVRVAGRSRSSYTGLFIGFGLNTDNWKK